MVIVATESADEVDRCLAALGESVPIVVAAGVGVSTRGLPSGATRIDGEPGASVPRLRALGLSATETPLVAFVEDGNVPSIGWAEAWRQAFADPSIVAASGPSEPSSGLSTTARALFLFEYARFLPGPDPGRLAGNNFAIRRPSSMPTEIHEWSVPGPLGWVPGAGVVHGRAVDRRSAVLGRFRDGLGFGRLAAGPRLGISWVALAPAIALAQALRLAASLATRRRPGRGTLAALPMASLLIAAWSFGEALGRSRPSVPIL